MLSERLIWKLKNDNEISADWGSNCESPRQGSLINGVSPVIRKLLAGRGIHEPEAIEKFLNPDLSDLHDPLLLPDMEKASARIRKAMKNGERIWVYGDYDVDGITSISILMKYFESAGIPAQYYIPDRMDEGYGLNSEAVQFIASKGCDVLITVDCGITSVKEAEVAKACNLDLIITDHHECPEVLPDAFALINPKRVDSLYPYEMLAGAGVAYKLALACSMEKKSVIEAEDAVESVISHAYGLEPDVHDELLSLAAIGTIADIAPLTGENRVLSKFGLEIINKQPILGIKQLIEKCGLSEKKITAGHIGYFLAPKINAAGRIGDPAMGVRLLIGHDFEFAAQTASQLVTLNEERQMKEREVLAICFAQIEAEKSHHQQIIVVHGEHFHSGIIGIVASRIVERYYRPVVVLSLDPDLGMAKGSARSVEGISIYEALDSGRDLYEKFGGHDMAAGLSFKIENLEAFKACMASYASQHITEEDLLPILKLEDELGPKDIDYRLMDQLEHLEPFGACNPKPVFSLKNLTVESFRRMGKGEEHIKISVSDGDRIYDAVAFNVGEAYTGIQQREVLDLAFTLEKNSFKGIDSIQMMIKDMRRERTDGVSELIYEFKAAENWFLNAVSYGAMTDSQELDMVKQIKFSESMISEIFRDQHVLVLCGSMNGARYLRNHYYDRLYRSMSFNFGSFEPDRVESKRIIVLQAPVLKLLKPYHWDQILLLDLELSKAETAMLLDLINATGKVDDVSSTNDTDDKPTGIGMVKTSEFTGHDSQNSAIKRAVPDRDILARIYKHLKSSEGKTLNLPQTCQNMAVSSFTLALSLSLMQQLGMLDYKLFETQLHFTLMPITGKMNLNETEAFKAIHKYKLAQT